MYPTFVPGPYKKGDIVAHPEDGSLWIAQRDMANAKSLPAENAYWDAYVDPNYVPADPLKEIKDMLTELSNRLTLVEQKLAGTPPPVEEPPIEEPPPPPPPDEEEPPVEEPPVVDPPVVQPPLIGLPVASVPFATETKLPTGAEVQVINITEHFEDVIWSINAGEKTLRLDRIINYPVGTPLMIPLGFEAGKGLRGTVGVNGGWPTKRFATLAEMNTATLVGGQYVGCLEDGNVYRKNGTTGGVDPYTHWRYYTNKIIPQGYKAKVVSSSVVDNKTVLVMDAAPMESVTNAIVCWDAESMLNKLFNMRDDFKLKPDFHRHFIFPEGKQFAISKRIEIQKTNGYDQHVTIINGNGCTIYSPKGFSSASVTVGAANTIIHDLELIGNFKDNGYGFHSYPVGEKEYWNNPYEQNPGFQFAAHGCLGYNLTVKNTASYALQLWNDGHFRDCKVIMEEGIREYTGWQIHAINTYKGSGFRNISFWSPYICNALEASRATNVSFEHIHIVNGIAAFNSTGACRFANSKMIMKEHAQEGSFINRGHPYIDANGYMAQFDGAIDFSHLGLLIENVEFIQEGFVNKTGGTLRAISGGVLVKNALIKNCKYTRPNFANQHGNQHAVWFSDADNNVVDGFEIVGKQTFEYIGLFSCDFGMGENGAGTGAIRNIKGASAIVAAQGVIVENVNPDCQVLVYNK